MRILARPSTVGTILIESNFNIKEETSLDRTNTVIVGGGQAGLAISFYLKQEGLTCHWGYPLPAGIL